MLALLQPHPRRQQAAGDRQVAIDEQVVPLVHLLDIVRPVPSPTSPARSAEGAGSANSDNALYLNLWRARSYSGQPAAVRD